MNRPTAEQIRIWTAQIAASDREAFESLFRLMYPQLVRFAMRYTRRKSTAGDIVQDAFVALWEKREEADPNRSLRAYLYTSVRNRALNHIRDHARRTVDLEQVPDARLKAPEAQHAHDGTDNRNELIQKWIKTMPDRQREAFELSRFNGLDHDEIALVMGISSNTVNNHIVAALRHLREKHALYRDDNK